MRPGQQNNNNNNNNNKRMRGRNRKGPNPLTRSFESNGPDVKIRGTALHIAEKYVTLARDAQSSGDRVMAENYLQHAEHYFRVIAAAQVQNPLQPSQYRQDSEEEGLDEEDDRFSDRFGQHDRFIERGPGEGDGPVVASEPQPYVNGNGNGHYQNGGERPIRERGERQDRQEGRQESRQEGRSEGRQEGRQDARQEGRQEGRPERREPRAERPEGDRQEVRSENRPEGRPEGRQERAFRPSREDRGPRPERGERPIRSELPRFVTGDSPQPIIETVAPAPAPIEPPVVEPVLVPQPIEAVAIPGEASVPAGEEEMFRPRRRRATRARTRRTDVAEGAEAEPTLAIEAVDEE